MEEGITYYNEFKNKETIGTSLIGNDVNMLICGNFDNINDKNMDFDAFGYGLKKTLHNKGGLYCENSINLFSLNAGYVGIVLEFEDDIINGVLNSIESYLEEHLLWGTNIHNKNVIAPGLYAALTSSGIIFKISSSYGDFRIIDNTSTLNKNTSNFFEFLWDANGLDIEGFDNITIAIRINGIITAIGNVPIPVADFNNIPTYILNENSNFNNLSCIIRKLIISNVIKKREWSEFIIDAKVNVALSIYFENAKILIDWGDNTKDVVNGTKSISHKYSIAQEYTLKISGECSHFKINSNLLKEIKTPIYLKNITSFEYTFADCAYLLSPPEDTFKYQTEVLSFAGLFGFYGYHEPLISEFNIPENLFKYNIKVENFDMTFMGNKILNSIPENLFKYNINAIEMQRIFSGCTSLTDIPENLFKYNINAENFWLTFANCDSLTTIPSKLFYYNLKAKYFSDCLSNTAITNIPSDIFNPNGNVERLNTCFANCVNLTGDAPELWKIYPNADGGICFYNCTGLDNYNDIPNDWK